MLQDISREIKVCRQKARADRAAAATLKTLKERIGTKKTPAAVKPPEKKGVRYARKRTVETDPE